MRAICPDSCLGNQPAFTPHKGDPSALSWSFGPDTSTDSDKAKEFIFSLFLVAMDSLEALAERGGGYNLGLTFQSFRWGVFSTIPECRKGSDLCITDMI